MTKKSLRAFNIENPWSLTQARDVLSASPLALHVSYISLMGGNCVHVVELASQEYMTIVVSPESRALKYGVFTAGVFERLRELTSPIQVDDYAYPCALYDSLEDCFYRSDW